VYSPPYAKLLDLDHDDIARRIREAKPDIVLVALGAPKQEKWIYMHYRKLGVPLCIGIGASLDFVAGKFSRAPEWMSHCGLEWAYRLMQEPKRLFQRYWTDFRFFIRALREHKRLMGKSIASVSVPPEPTRWPGIASYEWAGRADAAAVTSGQIAEPSPQDGRVHVVLNLSGVTFIDSSGLGVLLKGFKQCKEAGGALILVSPSEVVRDLLAVSKLSRLLPCADNSEAAHRLIYLDRLETRAFSENDRPNQRVIFRCLGEINAANADEFRELVQMKWGQEAAAKILEIDFTRVDFIDSSGLGCLLRARKLVAAREGAALRLTGVNDNLRNVITLARLDEVLGLAKAS
jgi:N-acetylglucosaminyldiphosphoundecaprenol N-acetyl-beta-D-mannosaminyltransferase